MAVMMYIRFPLSLRNVEDRLLAKGDRGRRTESCCVRVGQFVAHVGHQRLRVERPLTRLKPTPLDYAEMSVRFRGEWRLAMR